MPNIQENYTQNQLDIIEVSAVNVAFDTSSGDSIRLTLLDENGNFIPGKQFYSNSVITGTIDPQIQIYENNDGNIFVKPNDILDENKVPSGNYILQFDFLRNSTYSDKTLQNGYFIKEISPSRKEVRLLQDDSSAIIGDTEFDNLLVPELGEGGIDTGNLIFDYNWILGVSGGQNLSIVNFSEAEVNSLNSIST